MPDPGRQETVYCRALQDLLFIKSLLSKAESILSTQKQTPRGRQNGEAEKCITNERTR